MKDHEIPVAMQTLMICADPQFLETTRNVLAQLGVAPTVVSDSDAALSAIQTEQFDVVVVDWREIENLGEFLSGVRRSKLNSDGVLVAIVRDLLDLQQAFAAGVQLLIHKPASVVQIERCLRAAYSARVARRRKQHREPVCVLASVRTRRQPNGEALVVNVSESGVGLHTAPQDFLLGISVRAGEEIDLRFPLPDSDEILTVSGTVMWTTDQACGVRFHHMPNGQRAALQQWLTDCVERALVQIFERQVCA